jgi:Ca-activated chloride channel family protein
MPDFVYSQARRADSTADSRYAGLKRIYHHLLLASDGDVDRALAWLKRLDERHRFFDERFGFDDFVRRLLREGNVERSAETGLLALTSGGQTDLRRDSLRFVFSSLRGGESGGHRAPGTGHSPERLSETRPYTFGDDLSDLDYRTSIKNALRRAGPDLELSEDDLEVFATEASTSCATVIAIDISHSMTLYGEDRITPAKQVALALVELIRTRFPKDALGVVLFGDDAKEVPLERLPFVTNGPFHTNTREGLRVSARWLLARRHPNRRVFLVTDGKPSALTLEDGSLYKNPFSLDDRVVNKTLEEAAILRRRGIVVTTFMLTDDPYLVDFVDRFTRENRGQAYYATPDDLGSALLVDYVRNRKRRV